jgi:hypothetical protein
VDFVIFFTNEVYEFFFDIWSGSYMFCSVLGIWVGVYLVYFSVHGVGIAELSFLFPFLSSCSFFSLLSWRTFFAWSGFKARLYFAFGICVSRTAEGKRVLGLFFGGEELGLYMYSYGRCCMLLVEV